MTEKLATQDLIDHLLTMRGIVSARRHDFLHPSITQLHDPLLFTDMEKVVARIRRAMEQEEHIAVFADYDHDGIPGAVVFTDMLDRLGHDMYEVYIPHRNKEGFGLSTNAIDVLLEKGCTLMITIDCGITAVDEIAYAQERGMDVVVTDHHEPPEQPLGAYAVINPKYDDAYPFREPCGTGVIFKVTSAMFGEVDERALDLVALATLSDMVPLVDENRALAHIGLCALRKSTRPGIVALCKKRRLVQEHLSEDDVLFMITPCINAASRMDKPELAFNLLHETHMETAKELAGNLDTLNKGRRTAMATTMRQVNHRLEKRDELPDIVVAGDRSWEPGLLGLVAQKLAEEHARPVFIWGQGSAKEIKGSCRGAGVCDVVSLMHSVPDGTFVEAGGHRDAGGFSISAEQCVLLEETLNNTWNGPEEDTEQNRQDTCDAILAPADISWETYAQIELLGPFGHGYKKPVFCFESVAPKAVEMFGKHGEHTKLVFSGADGDIEAIAFFKKPDDFARTPAVSKLMTLHATIEKSVFRGFPELRLRIIEIK